MKKNYPKIINDLREQYKDVDLIFTDKEDKKTVIKFVTTRTDLNIPSEYEGVKIMVVDKFQGVFEED